VSDSTVKIVASDRLTKRINVALPIRVTCWDNQHQPHLEMACTYDISHHGARIMGLRSPQRPGEIVAVERGRSKAFCRIVWVGRNNSELRGQIGLECIETDKSMWESELCQMMEAYEPILRENLPFRPVLVGPGGVAGRRRSPRFPIDGFAELLRGDGNTLQAPVRDLGELGCLVTTRFMLDPGTNLKVVLNVANCDLMLRGEVRHAAQEVGLGIQFHEIRKGDRSVLQYILRKLAEQEEERNRERERVRAVAASI
jgi:PilZ domain-containing protein